MNEEKSKVKRVTSITIVAIFLISVVMALSMASPVVAADDLPTIWTDKTKYSLGEAIVIFGSGFTADGTVNIDVLRPDHENDTLEPVTTDGVGNFRTSYTPPTIPGRYKITATDGIDTAKTAVTEADAQGATKFQLIAFGVKVNTPVTEVTDIGWGRGNSQKGWEEGAWVPVKLNVSNVQTDYENLEGFPDVYIGFDYTSHDCRFVDLIRDIQIGASDLNDTYGWPQLTGEPYDTGSPDDLPTIAEVRAAQYSEEEAAWNYDDFVLANTLSTWDYEAQVNLPEGPTDSSLGDPPGAVDDGKHQFVIYGDQIREALEGHEGTENVVIYFQAHLARTFVWSRGLEDGYDVDPTNSWGGWLYGSDIYTAPDIREGSGFVPGSSGQMYLLMEHLGQVTCQLPVPPEPTGEITGFKWHDLNGDAIWDSGEPPIEDWTIRVISTVEVIDFMDTTLTLADGSYSFPDLTTGEYLIQEHKDLSETSTGWMETYPYKDAPFPMEVVIPFEIDLTEFPDDAAWGWQVELELAEGIVESVNNLNFGNVLHGCFKITKEVTEPEDMIGSLADLDDAVFTVTIDGPSDEDPDDVLFKLSAGDLYYWDPEAGVSGEWVLGDTVCICNLVPGDYEVTETAPDGWADAVLDPEDGIATVEAGVGCDDADVVTVTVTNTPELGCFKVTKEIDEPEDMVGSLADLDDVTFTVTIDGPSDEDPDDLLFGLIDGVLYIDSDGDGDVDLDDDTGDTYCICNLVPGDYEVTETAPDGWADAVLDPEDGIATVEAGVGCDDADVVTVTVTNTPELGCFKVTKEVDLDDYGLSFR
jgi:hypothetical protein